MRHARHGTAREDGLAAPRQDQEEGAVDRARHDREGPAHAARRDARDVHARGRLAGVAPRQDRAHAVDHERARAPAGGRDGVHRWPRRRAPRGHARRGARGRRVPPLWLRWPLVRGAPDRARDLRRALARARTRVRRRRRAALAAGVHDRPRRLDGRHRVARPAVRLHDGARHRQPRDPPRAARERARGRVDRGTRSGREPARPARRARRLHARVPLPRGACLVRRVRAGVARSPRPGEGHRLLRRCDRRLRAAGIGARSEARPVDPRVCDRQGEHRGARSLRSGRGPRAWRRRARGARDDLPADQRAEGDLEPREIVAARHREGDRVLRRPTRDRADAREARPQDLRADRERAPRALPRGRGARARALAGRQEQDGRAARRAPRGPGARPRRRRACSARRSRPVGRQAAREAPAGGERHERRGCGDERRRGHERRGLSREVAAGAREPPVAAERRKAAHAHGRRPPRTDARAARGARSGDEGEVARARRARLRPGAARDDRDERRERAQERGAHEQGHVLRWPPRDDPAERGRRRARDDVGAAAVHLDLRGHHRRAPARASR